MPDSNGSLPSWLLGILACIPALAVGATAFIAWGSMETEIASIMERQDRTERAHERNLDEQKATIAAHSGLHHHPGAGEQLASLEARYDGMSQLLQQIREDIKEILRYQRSRNDRASLPSGDSATGYRVPR